MIEYYQNCNGFRSRVLVPPGTLTVHSHWDKADTNKIVRESNWAAILNKTFQRSDQTENE